MEWDGEKIQAAVSTLTEALGETCVVSMEVVNGTREIEPVTDESGIQWRQYERDKLGDKVIITITVKK